MTKALGCLNSLNFAFLKTKMIEIISIFCASIFPSNFAKAPFKLSGRQWLYHVKSTFWGAQFWSKIRRSI